MSPVSFTTKPALKLKPWRYVQFKVKDHTQFFSVKTNCLENLIAIVDLRHLSNRKGTVLFQSLANTTKIFMQTRATGVVFGTALPNRVCVGDRGIGKVRLLANKIDHIHAEAVNSFVKPISHDIIDSCPHGRVFPVEIRLLRSKQMEVILSRCFIVFPRAPYCLY